MTAVSSRPFRAAVLMLLASCTAALAQSQNPACQRLEAQLASLDRGGADPARAEQMRRYDEAINKQQFELDRLSSEARRLDCGSSGFFSIFQSPSPQCSALTRQIEQMRGNVDRMRSEMQQLGGNLDRAGQRRAILGALGDNNCGPQYRSAGGGQRTLFDTLFGNNTSPSFPGGDTSGSTFRTICVRTCDGYYYPISFAVNPGRFEDDEKICQSSCPAAQVNLYTYRNPGEEVAQAVSLSSGENYSSLPTAFRYRQQYDAACSCRQPGQSWADALKQINDATVEQGDVVVTEQRARQMALPRDSRGRPIADPKAAKGAAGASADTKAAGNPGGPDAGGNDAADRKIRAVGPQFMPAR